MVVHLDNQAAWRWARVSEGVTSDTEGKGLTVVVAHARLVEHVKQVRRQFLFPDRLEEALHRRVVAEIAVLVFEAEVGRVQVDHDGRRRAPVPLQDLSREARQVVRCAGHAAAAALAELAVMSIWAGDAMRMGPDSAPGCSDELRQQLSPAMGF